MATPGKVDFTDLRAGDTWPGATITVQLNGSPLDISNHTIQMVVKDLRGKTMIDITDGNGISKPDPVNGVFRIDPLEVPHRYGANKHYIQLENAGVKKTYLAGIFKVSS